MLSISYHQKGRIALCGNVQDRKALVIYLVNVSTILLEHESHFKIASENSVMQTSKAFVVSGFEPLNFTLLIVFVSMSGYQFIILLEVVLGHIKVIVVGSNM